MTHRAALTVSVLVLVLMTALASAQVAQPLDAGTFSITGTRLDRQALSTEEFTIVRNTDGGFTVTTVTSDGRRMRSVLTTDSRGNPTAYEHHGVGGEAVEKTITSKRDGGVLVISEVSTRNPPFAPFRFPANTLLFGDGGMAQLWFLGLGSAPRDVSYFEPGLWREQHGRLSDAGPDSVTIEGKPVAATHLVLSGGLRQRDVWLDGQKRLLKVSLQTSVVAVRTKLPQ